MREELRDAGILCWRNPSIHGAWRSRRPSFAHRIFRCHLGSTPITSGLAPGPQCRGPLPIRILVVLSKGFHHLFEGLDRWCLPMAPNSARGIARPGSTELPQTIPDCRILAAAGQRVRPFLLSADLLVHPARALEGGCNVGYEALAWRVRRWFSSNASSAVLHDVDGIVLFRGRCGSTKLR